MPLASPHMTMSHNAAQPPALSLLQPDMTQREWEPPVTSH